VTSCECECGGGGGGGAHRCSELIEDLVVQFSALPRPLDELRNLNLRLLAVPVRPELIRDLDQLVGVVQHCVPHKFQRDEITMNMFM